MPAVTVLTRRVVVAIGVLSFSSLGAFARAQNRPAPVSIRAEPLVLRPGDPISKRALVSRPAPVKGLLGWTIESRRHRAGMNVLATSPDGTRIATGGIDGTIRLWNAADGELQAALLGHDSYVYGLSWSPDGNSLASAGSFDGTIRVWDVKTGRVLRVHKGPKEHVMHVAWSPDGTRLLAAGGYSGWVWMWTVLTDEAKTITELGQSVLSLAWSPDGERIAMCGNQLPVSIYEVAAKEVNRTFGTGDDGYTAVVWAPDSKRLAAGSSKEAVVWELGSEQSARRLAGAAVTLAWSREGQTLAAGNGSFEVQLWDASTGKAGAKIATPATRLDWLGAGSQLASITSTQLAIADTATAKAIWSQEKAGSTPPIWTAGRPIITGFGGKSLALWETTSGKFLRTLDGHAAAVSAVAWSRDGKTLATASYDKTVKLWEVGSGKVLHTFQGHTAAVTDVIFSHDGKTLVSAGQEPVIRMWTVATGAAAGELSSHSGPVAVLAWLPSGSGLASGGADGSVVLWNIAKQQAVRTLSASQPVQSMAWSPDGKLLACGTVDDTVRVFQASSGQNVANLKTGGSPPNVSGVAWSADGRGLLSGRGNHTAQLWDVSANKVVHSVATMAPVQYVEWPAGSPVVATGNQERTVRFWEAPTGFLRGVLLDESEYVVWISAEGNYRLDLERKPDFVFVTLAADAQTILRPEEFASKYKWRNQPAAIKITGKP